MIILYQANFLHPLVHKAFSSVSVFIFFLPLHHSRFYTLRRIIHSVSICLRLCISVRSFIHPSISPSLPLQLYDTVEPRSGTMVERDAQRQYVVIGTLAPITVECLLFLCGDWGSGPEGGDVPLNQGCNKWDCHILLFSTGGPWCLVGGPWGLTGDPEAWLQAPEIWIEALET